MTNNQTTCAVIVIDAKTKKVLSLLTLESQFEKSFKDVHEVEIENTEYDYQEMFFIWLEMIWEDGMIEIVSADAFVLLDEQLPESMTVNNEIIL